MIIQNSTKISDNKIITVPIKIRLILPIHRHKRAHRLLPIDMVVLLELLQIKVINGTKTKIMMIQSIKLPLKMIKLMPEEMMETTDNIKKLEINSMEHSRINNRQLILKKRHQVMHTIKQLQLVII